MRITLKNIRQHLDRTIDLPDTGLVKLSGKSGIGKSTILDAIRHALLGDVDDIVNWDQDHAAITLQWLGIEVKRTMRPNTLTFTAADGTTSKDDEAQEAIFKWLSMNGEELLASSFIEQGMPSSLLSLKPAEQLRFIQRLAFGKEDPEVTKKRIAALVSDRKARLSISESAALNLVPKVDDANKKVAELKESTPKMIAKCRTPEEVSALELRFAASSGETKSLNKEIREARLSLDNPIFRELSNLENTKATYTETVSGLNQQIAQLHNELSKLPGPDRPESRTRRASRLAEINDGLAYLSILDEAKARSIEIKAKFELEGSPLEGLKTKLVLLMEENAAISMEQSTLVTDLNRLRGTPEAQQCPGCQMNLMIDDGRIVAHSHAIHDLESRIITLEQAIEQKSLERRQNQRARDGLTAAASQLESLKGKLTAHKKPSFATAAEAEEELARIQDETADDAVLEAARSKLITKIDTLGKMLENTATKHELYVSSLNERRSKTQPIESIKKKIEKFESDLLRAQAESEACMDVLTSERENARIASQAREHAARLEAAEEMAEQLELQFQDAETEAVAAFAAARAALRLKELSDRAAMEAIDSIMAGINVNSRHYIDSMFPDDGTVVQLTNKKVLSDGEERPKPGIKVTHKGSNPKNIGSFSGGEKMRVALGFQLGLSDMYHSPLLMIDEALAWLGLEDKERCLETLRPLAEKRLILIVEHGLPDSMVDHIVNL